jgi:PhnB protein
MLGITPYITFRGNCREAIEFYKSALGAEVAFVQTFGESPMDFKGPADNIMHASLKVGNSTIMMSDDPNPQGGPGGGGDISLTIGLSDTAKAKEVFDKLAKGGSVIMALEKTFWADAFGMLTDKFGVRWMINCEARH